MAALSEAPRAGRTVIYGIALEGAYNAEVETGGGANVCGMTCDPLDINPDLNIQVFRADHASNQPLYSEDERNTSGSAPTTTITGPINHHWFGILCGSFFHTGTWTAETFTGPYTFVDPGSEPVYDGDQKSFTLYAKDSVAGRSEILTGGECIGLKITGEKKGVLQFEANVQGATLKQNQTLSGTWQYSGSKPEGWGRIHFERCSYKVDAGSGDTTIKPQNFEVTCGYDLVSQEQTDAAGGYEALAKAGPNGTFSTTMLKDSTSALLRTRRDVGDGVTLTIGGRLDLVCTGKIDTDPSELEGLTKTVVSCKMLAKDEDSDMISVDW